MKNLEKSWNLNDWLPGQNIVRLDALRDCKEGNIFPQYFYFAFFQSHNASDLWYFAFHDKPYEAAMMKNKAKNTFFFFFFLNTYTLFKISVSED